MERYVKIFMKPALNAVLLLASQFTMVLVVFGYAFAMGEDFGSFMLKPMVAAGMMTSACILSVIMSCALGLVKKESTLDFKNFHFPASTLLLIPIAWLGIFAFNIFSEHLTLIDNNKILFENMANNVFGIIALSLIGPLAEEIVFREAFIGHAVRNGCNSNVAIMLSAFAFGIIHGNPSQIPFAFCMGIILGVTYVKTGNIVIPAIIHITNNLTAALLIGAEGISEEMTLTNMLGGSAVALPLALAALVLCYYGLFKEELKIRRQS